VKKIVFITPPGARHGFSISGVVQYTSVPEEAEATLRRVLADPDSGVVAIDERLLAGVDEKRLREMERRWFGILIVLPAPEELGGEAGEDYAMRIIRQAIGYHVRLQP